MALTGLEFKKRLIELLDSKEGRESKLLELTTEIEELIINNENLTLQNTKLEETAQKLTDEGKDLKERLMTLYLKQDIKVESPPEPKEELSGQDYIDKFVRDLKQDEPKENVTNG